MGKKILKELSQKSSDEFSPSMPKGYVTGKTKYVVTFGTVMSGLGKGIFSSSLAKVLQDKGLKVSPIKLEGYLNVDSGTLNPFRHGEVFVIDDGLECDMDLGTYERILDINLTKSNYSTNGQLFSEILDNERKGGYMGRDVQFIPHVTGQIKKNLRKLAMQDNSDVVFVEIGGTVGDLENSHYIEAMRELSYEEGQENVCFVALTYILEPHFLGEQKSKAAQLGIRMLQSKGIQPHIIGCRSRNSVTKSVREKISISSNVPVERVMDLHDSKSIYLIPNMIRENNIGKSVIDLLRLNGKVDEDLEEKNIALWKGFTDKIKNYDKGITIGVTGKYTTIRDAYASIIKALEHCSVNLETKVNIKWIDTTDIEEGKIDVKEALEDVDGVIIPGGFGRRGSEGKIMCVNHARKNRIPFLGICLGFQMAVIEFARNVCRMKDANSTEFDTDCNTPVIDYLPEQLKIEGLGGNMRLGARMVEVKPDTFAHEIYGNTTIKERFRHRYEVNPEMIKELEKNGLIFSGKAPNQPIMQILELDRKDHPYFVAGQFHPEFLSRPLRPAPLFLNLCKAALKNKK